MNSRNKPRVVALFCVVVAATMLPGAAAQDIEDRTIAIPNLKSTDIDAGAGVTAGGSASGSFSWSCFGLTTPQLGVGCTAAAAFSATATYSFLAWDFSYSVGYAACGGLVSTPVSAGAHVICTGSVGVNGEEAGFGCDDVGPLTGTDWIGSCNGSSAEVSSDECTYATANGDSTAVPAVRTTGAAAAAWSAGCGDALLHKGFTRFTPDQERSWDDIPPEALEGIRAAAIDTVVGQLKQDLLESGAPPAVEKIVDAFRDNLEATPDAIVIRSVLVD